MNKDQEEIVAAAEGIFKVFNVVFDALRRGEAVTVLFADGTCTEFKTSDGKVCETSLRLN